MASDREVDGIALTIDGERRHVYDIARDFVREQSKGEWGDELIARDARKLMPLMKSYAAGGRSDAYRDARAFVCAQSEGEWDEPSIDGDARNLVALLESYAESMAA